MISSEGREAKGKISERDLEEGMRSTFKSAIPDKGERSETPELLSVSSSMFFEDESAEMSAMEAADNETLFRDVIFAMGERSESVPPGPYPDNVRSSRAVIPERAEMSVDALAMLSLFILVIPLKGERLLTS